MISQLQAWSTDDLINFHLFISGNEKGFTYLYKRLYKPSLYYAYSLIEDNIEIDCITQDAFLYVWQRRNKIENLNHFYASVRLFVKWGCIRYAAKHKRNSSVLANFYNIGHTYKRIAETEVADLIDENPTDELIELLTNAIQYLPATRKNILTLYQNGVSPQQISKHLGVSCRKVNTEMKKSVVALKHIMPTLQKAHQARQDIRMPVANYEAYLNKKQAQICTLYYKNKQPFSFISQELGLAPFELVKEHYEAMQILSKVKTNKR
jgi:RNA polymerase sigma factor (sigma-70 family)